MNKKPDRRIVYYNRGKKKCGVYYGKIKHTVRYRGPQLALVKFDGNKRASKVPVYLLHDDIAIT